MSLNTIATCLTVTVNRKTGWKQSATCKDAAENVATTTGATKSRISVKTSLLDLTACDDIKKLYVAIGDAMLSVGTSIGPAKYLVPAALAYETKQMINSFQARLDRLKNTLADQYANFLDTQEICDLAGLFDRKNYADVNEVLAGTSITYEFDQLSDSSKFAAMFSDAQLVAELQAANDERLAKASEQVANDIRGLLLEQVSASMVIVDKFHNQSGKRLASESACERLQQVAANVDRLNNLMLVTPDSIVGTMLARTLAAIPSDHNALKDAATGKAFIVALQGVIALGKGQAVPIANVVDVAVEDVAVEDVVVEDVVVEDVVVEDVVVEDVVVEDVVVEDVVTDFDIDSF